MDYSMNEYIITIEIQVSEQKILCWAVCSMNAISIQHNNDLAWPQQYLNDKRHLCSKYMPKIRIGQLVLELAWNAQGFIYSYD